MTPVLYALGRGCARHRRIVLAAWVVLLVAVAAAASAAGERTNNDLTLVGSDSQRATDLLRADFPEQANGTVPVVIEARGGARVDTDAADTAVGEVAAAYAADPLVAGVVSPLESQGTHQRSADGRTEFLNLALKGDPGELTDGEADRLLALAAPAEAAGLDASIGAYVGQKLSRPSSRTSEVIGLGAALVILLLTFGTVVAMGLPIITAVVGLVVGLGGVTLLAQVSDVPTTGPALATMIGLGVGVDYGLFVVTRHREQFAAGMELTESIARATATAGGAVLFAGSTVIIALLSLAVAGVPLVTQLGYLSALVVAIAVVAAVTLMPALLAAVGRRIDALPLQTRAKGADDATRPGGWARLAHAVTGRPLVAIAGALVVLGVFTAPIVDLTLGQTDDGALSKDTQTRRSYDALSRGFGPGANGPLLVVAALPSPATSLDDPRIASMSSALAGEDGVKATSSATLDDAGTSVLLTVTPEAAPSSPEAEALVGHLRDVTLPRVAADTGLDVHVGGTTARYIDLASTITAKLPLVIAVVLGLSFVLLVLAFRSLLIPLKAVVVNLLSIGAAFGVVTYVFGHAWSARLVGLDGAVPIVSFVPLMMFAILFGLSMDYEVFLMSKVHEEFAHHGEPRRAVVDGLAGTARVITSAALIMVSVFLAFVLSGDPNIKQFGVGMAFAVAIDATLVRCLLVPAIVVLLGRRAWGLPGWLDRRTPHLSIEGEAFFADRDRLVAAEQEAPADAPSLR